MAIELDPGVVILPRSFLDTDLYKVGTIRRFHRTTITRTMDSSPCSKPCCTTSLVSNRRIDSRIATPTYTSPAPVTSSSSYPYLVRTRFPLPHRPTLVTPVCGRVLHPITDLRRACLAPKHLSIFQARLHRFPLILSLPACPSSGDLCATWTRERRWPHRDRSLWAVGGGDPLGGAPHGDAERDLLYDCR